MVRNGFLKLAGITTLALALAAGPAFAGNYVGGGTFVAKTGLTGTLVDDGATLCFGTNGDGIGGGCLPFKEAVDGTFVEVRDDAHGRNVAFQVCIDNNGDGVCGGPLTDPKCPDQAFFSHSDGGEFFNPLGPLPTGFLRGCSGGFPGYVVFLCQGVHEDQRTGPHVHETTGGEIGYAEEGVGYGNFCGGSGPAGDAGENPTVAKAYRVM